MRDIEDYERSLGRLHIPDERDNSFPMQAMIPREVPKRHFKYWYPSGWWGDQGRTPQCVAYAWIHWLEDGGVTQDHKQAPVMNPSLVYRNAQLVDQWEGDDYDGTSVRAGAKVLKANGYIESYRWTQDVEVLAQAILTTASVVVGTYWFSDMSRPNNDNIITPTGSMQGGHAYIINGYNAKTGYFRVKNSWGRAWGNKGYAYIKKEDMQKLLSMYGEACLAVEIKK